MGKVFENGETCRSYYLGYCVSLYTHTLSLSRNTVYVLLSKVEKRRAKNTNTYPSCFFAKHAVNGVCAHTSQLIVPADLYFFADDD